MFDRTNRPYLERQGDPFRPWLGSSDLKIGCGIGSILNLMGRRDLIVRLHPRDRLEKRAEHDCVAQNLEVRGITS
jgi:hypothetical protein